MTDGILYQAFVYLMAAVIAVPTTSHAEVALAAIDAGVHLGFSRRVAVDLDHPLMRPVRDPLRSLVYTAAERAVKDVLIKWTAAEETRESEHPADARGRGKIAANFSRDVPGWIKPYDGERDGGGDACLGDGHAASVRPSEADDAYGLIPGFGVSTYRRYA